MGIIVYNPAVPGIRGRIGDLVFHQRKGTPCFRARVVPLDPTTAKRKAR